MNEYKWIWMDMNGYEYEWMINGYKWIWIWWINDKWIMNMNNNKWIMNEWWMNDLNGNDVYDSMDW